METATTTRRQRSSCRLFSVLASAISEWCLMVLLFFNALLSHVATKFAISCRLPAPCLLCSRLDRILGNGKNQRFRYNLLCRAHKMEISSLAYCPDHRRLAYAGEMCEACLLSSTKQRKSNFDAHSPFVGMLEVEHGEESAEVPLTKKDVDLGSLAIGLCSCCSQRFQHKNYPHRLLKVEDIGADIANLIVQEGMSKKIKKSIGSTTIDHSKKNASYGPLLHVGYRKLNITSDSDSEVPFSDDDDGNSRACVIEDVKHESESGGRQSPMFYNNKKAPTVVISEDIVPEKLIHPTPLAPKRCLLDAESELISEEKREKSLTVPAFAIGHGLEEINWSQVEVRANHICEHVSKEASNQKLITQNDDIHYAPASSDTEVMKEPSSTSRTSQVLSDPRPLAYFPMDRNDSFKLSLYHKGSVLSPRFSEIVAAKESSRVQEDLMMRLANISSSRGLELPWSDMAASPKVQMLGDEVKSLYSFSSMSLLHNSKRLSIERTNSCLDSVEGETSIEHLKRQLELDRKSMTALYKELEEERNASAIAASEAMAMINRLQEEKASMQMEALQYLRMMEEQAEYDQEAIQKLNDLLTDREKELLDFEAELESYRKRFGDDLAEEKVIEPLGAPEIREFTSSHNLQCKKPLNHSTSLTGTGIVQDPLLNFEEEKAYILECLRKLQEELHMHTSDGGYSDDSQVEVEKDCKHDKACDDCILQVGSKQENATSEVNSVINNHSHDNELEKHCLNDVNREDNQIRVELLAEKGFSRVEDNHTESRLKSNSTDDRKYSLLNTSEVNSLQVEVSNLSKRLEALEEDRSFLQLSTNILQNANDGIQFIQEIACYLHELRRIQTAQSGGNLP